MPSCTEDHLPTGPSRHDPTTLIDAGWPGGDQRLLMRPILPGDHGLLADFLLSQSATARRNRFHAALHPSPRLCRQMSQIDHRHQLALVVSHWDGGLEQLVAEARYGMTRAGFSAEFALMVDERWQGRGVGTWVLRALQRAASLSGLAWLEGQVLPDNRPMLTLARRCGFTCLPDPQDTQLLRVQHRLPTSELRTAMAGGQQRPRTRWQRLRQALAGARPTLPGMPPAHGATRPLAAPLSTFTPVDPSP